jgi:hypothetical protein
VPAGERALAAAPGISIGILSAIQGTYSPEQMMLDIGQGARIATSAYDTAIPPSIGDWPAVLARAEAAPQTLRPGLLASSVPGGAGAVATDGYGGIAAAAAVDRRGRLGALSAGPGATLLARVTAMRARKQLVTVDLPGGAAGRSDLQALAAARPANELLIVLQYAVSRRGHELLWLGVAGLAGGGGRELSSRTTSQRGLVSAIDLAPTILRHLGLAIPVEMRGEPIETHGSLDSPALRSLMARLRVVGGRRLKALGVLLCAWAALLLGAALLDGARGTSGEQGGRSRAPARAWAMRAGALGILWAPAAVLVTAALEPSAAVEYAAIALLCLALGAIGDALLPWPRAPLAPAVASVLALSVDALAHTQLLVRSLLGPNPILGARFYGFGNELKPALAVLVLAAVAAALHPAARTRGSALAMAGAGAALAAIVGAARIGAGVGGAILVAVGFAVAAILLWPGGFSRRRALIALGAPVLALVALALIDLATAGGSGHYTGSILHASSAGEVRDVIERRYAAAWRELRNHAMPFATALALAAAVAGVRRRKRLLAPVGGDQGWLAALGGGLAAGVAGTLVEDSGPVLLLVAVFALGCICAYLWGRPPSSAETPKLATASATIAVDGGSEGTA